MKTETLVHIGSRKNILPREILKLVADVNYTIVHLDDGSKICTATNLGTIEKRLTHLSFFRVNRSIIINLDHLNKFKVCCHKDKALKPSHKHQNIVMISRRRMAAFEACVNA
ncbi:LytTR family transcriptional regulator [Lacihabitans sp. LS3-19]|uniref:LytTR family DNA-binding domain-containing protein n=1 Tax=Lacihabitans sp. LS3-19 TaxID=2487335 RepID=UPI0020CB7413|nr:LytTR family DNA-binding domain-containing protein [Lacihabitans sp. LS3-19]MCP9770977.1 LytTR family transcriptional regulator [Lacihabitans sp. LS3-19]